MTRSPLPTGVDDYRIGDDRIALAEAIADGLADPAALPRGITDAAWWRQTLGHGAPGIALLHIELAASGRRPWERAHQWLRLLTTGPITTGGSSHPFYGGPAIAHVLACARDARPRSYNEALAVLDEAILADVQARVESARERLDSGKLPVTAEFDAIRGLAGYGAYLLHRHPGQRVLRDLLSCVVRLTGPLTHDNVLLPGWWTLNGPSGHPDQQFPGGHGNAGMAHGIGGPLALLALAARAGVVVDGQITAITAICDWLDAWRWPYWITRADLDTGTVPIGVRRPSWCYGAAGLARAHQLAALTVHDEQRRAVAEQALLRAVSDGPDLDAITDPSLCHGHAGLLHVITRALPDTAPQATAQLRDRIQPLLAAIHPPAGAPRHTVQALLQRPGAGPDEGGPGLLAGAAGIALAALGSAVAPRTSWDTFLLIH